MIEIRELVIRATVESPGATRPGAGGRSEASQGQTDVRLKEALEQLTAMIKEKNER